MDDKAKSESPKTILDFIKKSYFKIIELTDSPDKGVFSIGRALTYITNSQKINLEIHEALGTVEDELTRSFISDSNKNDSRDKLIVLSFRLNLSLAIQLADQLHRIAEYLIPVIFNFREHENCLDAALVKHTVQYEQRVTYDKLTSTPFQQLKSFLLKQVKILSEQYFSLTGVEVLKYVYIVVEKNQFSVRWGFIDDDQKLKNIYLSTSGEINSQLTAKQIAIFLALKNKSIKPNLVAEAENFNLNNEVNLNKQWYNVDSKEKRININSIRKIKSRIKDYESLKNYLLNTQGYDKLMVELEDELQELRDRLEDLKIDSE
mgnify:CR=1 FL=1